MTAGVTPCARSRCTSSSAFSRYLKAPTWTVYRGARALLGGAGGVAGDACGDGFGAGAGAAGAGTGDRSGAAARPGEGGEVPPAGGGATVGDAAAWSGGGVWRERIHERSHQGCDGCGGGGSIAKIAPRLRTKASVSPNSRFSANPDRIPPHEHGSALCWERRCDTGVLGGGLHCCRDRSLPAGRGTRALVPRVRWEARSLRLPRCATRRRVFDAGRRRETADVGGSR